MGNSNSGLEEQREDFSGILGDLSVQFLSSMADQMYHTVLSSLCNRYQTPECNGTARSRISDTEDPFQGRDLTG